MKIAPYLMVVMMAAAVGGMMIAGCESTSSISNLITVTPDTVTLEGANAVATFTASGGTNAVLVLPLQWSVSDPGLGTILSSVGVSAVYQSTGTPGNNVITVRDQAEASGLATVVQP